MQTADNNPTTVTCRFINGGGAGASTATTRSQYVRDDNTLDNFTLTALFAVTSGQKLQLQCSKEDVGSSARILAANIVAVQVSDITGFTD